MGNDLKSERNWSGLTHHKQAPCKEFNLYKTQHENIMMVRYKHGAISMKGVYTFNRFTNTWTKSIKFPNDFVKAYTNSKQRNDRTYFFSAAYDDASALLYLVKRVEGDSIEKIFQLNLDTLQWKDITSNLKFKDSWAKFMFINHKLHIVETSIFKRHVYYDNEANQWNSSAMLKNEVVKTLVHHNYCYCKTKNLLYLFASDTASYDIYNHNAYFVDSIGLYDIIADKWSKINIDIPKEFNRNFHIIHTPKDTVRLLVCETKDIFIFDMEVNTICKSKVKIPRGNYKVITVGNGAQMATLLRGYVAQWIMRRVPKEICDIIVSMMTQHYVHLVGYLGDSKEDSKERKHFSINLDQVLMLDSE